MPTVTESPKRLVSLDVLRGIAILGMMLSGVVPSVGLPLWMYHVQTAPPQFPKGVVGVSWVDMVFPAFVFTLGAAIPIAWARRDVPAWKTAWTVLSRAALLVLFAFVAEHLRPLEASPTPSRAQWALGMLGFALVLAMFARLPQSWPKWAAIPIRLVGAAGVYLLVRGQVYADGTVGWTTKRVDIILLVLGAMALFATTTWLLTRTHLLARLATLAGFAYFKLAATVPDTWASALWKWQGVEWFFRPMFLGYLLAAIPGTIAGDVLVRPRQDEPGDPAWLPLAASLGVPAMLSLFLMRESQWAILPLVALAWLAWRTGTRAGEIVSWGAIWTLFGVLLDPFEGGIKKTPHTFSYLVGMAGLACLLLGALVAWERLRGAGPGARFVAATGQNPMLAYVAITNLVAPLWALTIGAWITALLPGILPALLQTLLLALLVWGFTRLRIVMRA